MSSIIRSTGRSREAAGTVHPVAYNFNDMTGQANEYLAKVRAEAANILAKAQQEADQIRESAEQAGREAGMQEVERITADKVAQQMQTLLPAMQKTIVEIEQSKQVWLKHWQASAVKVATAIASRVIRREVAQQPEITVDLIVEALQLAAGSAEVVIHLHPDDARNLGEQIETVTAQFKNVAPASIVADARISPGGCRVETKYGEIDQQFESQLKRIEEELA